MKKEMIWSPVQVPSVERTSLCWSSPFAGLRKRIELSVPIVRLSRCYTRLSERRITPLQTLHLLHIQAAFGTFVFPLAFPLLVRALMLVWFVVALLQGRRSGL